MGPVCEGVGGLLFVEFVFTGKDGDWVEQLFLEEIVELEK